METLKITTTKKVKENAEKIAKTIVDNAILSAEEYFKDKNDEFKRVSEANFTIGVLKSQIKFLLQGEEISLK
jgi:cation transport regulator ChaB